MVGLYALSPVCVDSFDNVYYYILTPAVRRQRPLHCEGRVYFTKVHMYIKKFSEWFKVKERLNDGSPVTFCRAGEIRWVSFGVNVGSEIDGKGESFTRPALIIHASGTHVALVVPLTTQTKSSRGYFPLEWKQKNNMLCINQMRVVSQKRIFSRLSKISDAKLLQVKEEIKKFYLL